MLLYRLEFMENYQFFVSTDKRRASHFRRVSREKKIRSSLIPDVRMTARDWRAKNRLSYGEKKVCHRGKIYFEAGGN